MIRLRVVVVSLAALMLFAWQDVMLWDRTLRGALDYAGTYHDGWRVMRDALVVIGVGLLWPRRLECVFYASTLFLFSVNGFVDLLFFGLNGQALPEWLSWSCDPWHICILPGPLDGPAAVVANVVTYVVAWGALWAGVAIINRKATAVALAAQFLMRRSR